MMRPAHQAIGYACDVCVFVSFQVVCYIGKEAAVQTPHPDSDHQVDKSSRLACTH